MISKEAVRVYLDRELEDFRWLKRISRREMKQALWRLSDRRYLFKTRPFLHQFVAFYICICYPRMSIHLDLGLGKTKVLLDVLRFRWMMEELQSTLVVVPTEINVEAWVEEVGIHSHFNVQPLLGSTDKKWKSFAHPADIYVTHYPGFVHMVSGKRPVKQRNGKKKNKLVVDIPLIKRAASYIQCLVFDEAHEIKNKDTVSWEAAMALSARVPFVYGMTGTPFGRNPMDFWAQMTAVDLGETFGESFEVFRQAFFKPTLGWAGKQDFSFNGRMHWKFHRVMQHRSIRYAEDECADLPELVETPMPMTLPAEQRAYYTPTKKSFIDSKGDLRAQEASYWQMRQLCSGFVILRDEDEETGEIEKETVRFKVNPKLIALQELLLELGPDEKLLVFHWFRESGAILEEFMKELGVPYSAVRGGTKDTTEQVRRFKQDKAVRVLVANIRSAGQGGNFQVANHIYCYESDSSPIKDRQLIKRVHRTGQTKRCFIHRPVMKNTVEKGIVDGLAEGRDLFGRLMNGSIDESDI